MKEIMRCDYLRMTGEPYRFGLKSIVTYLSQPQIRYMRWWRRYCDRNNPIIHLILLRYTHRYGLEISLSAKIGRGIYLGHPYNITIGGDVELGDNVNIHKGVTIGRENRGTRVGSPKVGNQVYIGINATIVGNVRIGNDVMIAPNSFINFDVPEHSIVVGNPGIIHHKDAATHGYIAFRV